MFKIGLTGGIGSGKTTVAAIFNILGIPVFNADVEARQLMEKDTNIIGAIKEIFGENSYEKGVLNRSFIAKIVFENQEKLQLLNNLVHPVTILAATQWMKQQTAAYVIKEAALLFESGSVADLDYVIGVTAPKAMRIKRILERDMITEELALARMNNQIDEVIKMKLCDFVLVNDEQTLLIPQVLKLHGTITNLGC